VLQLVKMREMGATINKDKRGVLQLVKGGGAIISKGGCYEYSGPRPSRLTAGLARNLFSAVQDKVYLAAFSFLDSQSTHLKLSLLDH
jgi:hypothetical protein